MDNIQKAQDLIKMAQADWEAGMASNIAYSICFHAQQASEKYLKAFLEFNGKTTPKTHNLADLISRCAEIEPEMIKLLPLADSLQLFGVEIRYSPSKEIADEKCPEAWNAMTKIIDEVKQKMSL